VTGFRRVAHWLRRSPVSRDLAGIAGVLIVFIELNVTSTPNTTVLSTAYLLVGYAVAGPAVIIFRNGRQKNGKDNGDE
jgi:hypothetical protein